MVMRGLYTFFFLSTNTRPTDLFSSSLFLHSEPNLQNLNQTQCLPFSIFKGFTPQKSSRFEHKAKEKKAGVRGQVETW